MEDQSPAALARQRISLYLGNQTLAGGTEGWEGRRDGRNEGRKKGMWELKSAGRKRGYGKEGGKGRIGEVKRKLKWVQEGEREEGRKDKGGSGCDRVGQMVGWRGRGGRMGKPEE